MELLRESIEKYNVFFLEKSALNSKSRKLIEPLTRCRTLTPQLISEENNTKNNEY